MYTLAPHDLFQTVGPPFGRTSDVVYWDVSIWDVPCPNGDGQAFMRLVMLFLFSNDILLALGDLFYSLLIYKDKSQKKRTFGETKKRFSHFAINKLDIAHTRYLRYKG